MELTLKFIEENFDKFNKLYWGGKLRKPTFEICHTKSLLGQFCFGRGQWKIRISDMFARDEKGYLNTLLHEMCHLWIRQNGWREYGRNKHHGEYFYREADRINRYGWHIARTDSVRGLGLTDKADAEYHLAAFKMKDGRYFLMCMNPKKVSFFERHFNASPSYYVDWFTFVSHDDKKYATYNKCVSRIRGYYIGQKEYEKLKQENVQTLSIAV